MSSESVKKPNETPSIKTFNREEKCERQKYQLNVREWKGDTAQKVFKLFRCK